MFKVEFKRAQFWVFSYFFSRLTYCPNLNWGVLLECLQMTLELPVKTEKDKEILQENLEANNNKKILKQIITKRSIGQS